MFIIAKALELDPKYVKALYRYAFPYIFICSNSFFILTSSIRRALCHLQSLKPQLAVADFKKVLKLDPKNALAKSQLEITQKLIRKVEFEKVRPFLTAALSIFKILTFRLI